MVRGAVSDQSRRGYGVKVEVRRRETENGVSDAMSDV